MTPAPDHWLVIPIVLPLLAAALLLFVERVRPAWQASLSLAVTVALLFVGLRLLAAADTGRIGVYLLGNWQAPFGIALVADRLAAMMLVLTAVIALASLAAAGPMAGRGPHFHAFFQVQMAGLNGAFLTGDVFNLFVFFEVLLIASYALMLHGAGGRALRAGLHFVVINLVGASLFLIAASLLYGVAGTLNFADLAVKLAILPDWNAGLARAAALLLLAVFGVKAALLPLGFWLPETYGSAPAPVAAFFAIMTKVGIYAIIRVTFTVFGGNGSASDGLLAGLGAPALFSLGLLTIVFGACGVLSARRLVALVSFLVLISSGTLIAASTLGPAALGGALYYLVHTTLTVAALFLVSHAIADQRGLRGDRFGSGPPPAEPVFLGLVFVIGAIGAAGLPPLPGFIGKVLMLQGSAQEPVAPWFWAAVLGSGLVATFALARAGGSMFWKTHGAPVGIPVGAGARIGLAILGAAGLVWMIGAGGATRFTMATAQQLGEPRGYVDAVLRHAPLPPSARSAP
ncbi:MAG TPA: monovalent cation/H+ antiporter subunit D [Casimicrobiaceae bacterium]|nr:monovalent cation/H+ antiporter subunit D [Casimicrobiaceae bacterium]